MYILSSYLAGPESVGRREVHDVERPLDLPVAEAKASDKRFTGTPVRAGRGVQWHPDGARLS